MGVTSTPCLLLAMALLGAPTAAVTHAPRTFRVVTFNIQALHHGPDAVVRALAPLRADIVALQEVDRNTLRSGGVDQAQLLAQRLGMHAQFAAALDLQGGQYGIAVLSRTPLQFPQVHPLPRLGDEEPRIALSVTTLAGGLPLRVFNTHLAADWKARNPQEIRRTQALALLGQMDGVKGGVLLLGDFNCGAPEPAYRALSRGLLPVSDMAPTFPASRPAVVLDHVWIRAATTPLKAVAVRTPPGLASDHLPKVVDLQWTSGPPG